MKFVIDVNLSRIWVQALHDSGHDAVYWADIGNMDDSDERIMKWARENDAHVLTTDLDFGAILAASGAEKPSVIQFRPGRHLPGKLMVHLLGAIVGLEQALQNGALVTIDPRAVRVRILPLSSNRLM